MKKFSASALATGVAGILAFGAGLLSASAETKMTDLNGEWRGTGNDRFLPIESFQQTNCQNTIRADSRRIVCDMICNGKTGLRKVIRLTASLDADQLEGSVSQKVSNSGDPSATEMNGTMSGQKIGDTASLSVRWTGLWPPTSVDLILHNSSSYSMHVTSLGLTMMNITFNRIAPH